MRRILLVVLLAACGVDKEAPSTDVPADEVALDDVDADGTVDFDVSDDLDTIAAPAPIAVRHVYGTSIQGQDLVYYKLTPPNPSGKKALLTFAVHGFEDAWKQDGRALSSIAHQAISYYGANPAKLAGWTVYIVPSANPDGMRHGVNNLREAVGAFGRCTSEGKDINRHVSQGTSFEQRKLKALFDAIGPTIAIDFHGWYNTTYGDATIGGFFQRAFNAAYTGKPAKYCFTDASGAMDCGPVKGGKFHGTTSIIADLFAEWVMSARGTPAALVEYPAPDFNNNGVYDSVWDADLGYRRMGKNTLDKMWGRTQVALTNLFAQW